MENAGKLVTVEEWLALDNDLRAELIEGAITYKVESVEHGMAQRSIGVALDPFTRPGGGGGGPGGWWIGTEIKVVYSGRPNGFRPDVVGWRRDAHPQRPSGPSTNIRPDWVCEIVSTNRGNDLIRKRRVLHEHGVPHYWTVDVARDAITVNRWIEGGYLVVAEYERDEGEKRLEPFEALSLVVGRLFGDD